MPYTFLVSFFAQSPLILGGLLVYWWNIPTKWIGWLGGYGVGAARRRHSIQSHAGRRHAQPDGGCCLSDDWRSHFRGPGSPGRAEVR